MNPTQTPVSANKPDDDKAKIAPGTHGPDQAPAKPEVQPQAQQPTKEAPAPSPQQS